MYDIDFLTPIYTVDEHTHRYFKALATEVPYSSRVILCLNGTPKVNTEIEELAKTLEPFHDVELIYEWPRIPVGHYRERLRLKSNAKWVTYIDSDDEVNVDLLVKLKSILDTESADVISFHTQEVPGEKIIMNSNTDVPFVVHAFYNESAISSTRFAAVNRLDDMTFNLKLKKMGIEFKKRSETWILRGDNGNSISHEDTSRKLPLDEILQTLKIFLSTYDYSKADIKYITGISNFNNSWQAINRWLNSDCCGDLKVLIVDKSVMSILPFIDMDVDTLLYQVDFEPDQKLPNYLKI